MDELEVDTAPEKKNHTLIKISNSKKLTIFASKRDLPCFIYKGKMFMKEGMWEIVFYNNLYLVAQVS